VSTLSDTHTLTMPDGTSFVVVESSAESAGARMEFEITMPRGAMGPPRHTHPEQEEEWRVVSGELSVQVGDDWQALAAGGTLAIPPGTVHTLKNRSQEFASATCTARHSTSRSTSRTSTRCGRPES